MTKKPVTLFGSAKARSGEAAYELAKMWELKNKGFIEAEKPVILVGGFWRPLVDLMAVAGLESSCYIHLADSPGQVKGVLVNG